MFALSRCAKEATARLISAIRWRQDISARSFREWPSHNGLIPLLRADSADGGRAALEVEMPIERFYAETFLAHRLLQLCYGGIFTAFECRLIIADDGALREARENDQISPGSASNCQIGTGDLVGQRLSAGGRLAEATHSRLILIRQRSRGFSSYAPHAAAGCPSRSGHAASRRCR